MPNKFDYELSSKIHESVFAEVAEECGVSVSLVRDVCKYPFRVLKDTIKSGALISVRFMHLGMFRVKNRKKDEINYYRKQKIKKLELS